MSAENIERAIVPVAHHELTSDRPGDYSDSSPAISDVQRHSVHPSTSGAADENKHESSSVPLFLPPEPGQTVPGHHYTSPWKWVVVFFSPIIGIAYLAFCYTVHYRPTAVPTMISREPDLSNTITTINIIVVSLTVFSLKGLLHQLQSEEFFRLLSVPKNNRGFELNLVNHISTSTYSLVDWIVAILRWHCSEYFVAAFISAAFIWAFSSLAPAALTVQPVLIDGPIMAFNVGAIPPLSLYEPVAAWQVKLASDFSPSPKFSSAVVWIEQEINQSYSFSVSDDPQGFYSGFVVPVPVTLDSTVNARWLTDVIGFNPYCLWANPINPDTTSLNTSMNSTAIPAYALSVHLQNLDLKVSIPSSYFPVYDSSFVTSINVHDPTVTLLNSTTGSLPTDGSMVLSVIQCASTNCTKEADNIIALFVNLADVPSMNFSSIGAQYEISFLVCKPNITIETREVRTTGSMTLEVQPFADGRPPYPRQGNLDWTQTSLLVSFSLSKLTTDSGPASSGWFGLGSGTQADFMFGSSQMNQIPSGSQYENSTLVLTPLPSEQLTRGYTRMVTASMKPYVSGLLGTTYVPGRIATRQKIFLSSLSHVIASTVLFFLLFMMATVAHFRRGKGRQFNLTNIATALANSELPETMKKTVADVISERELESRPRGWWGDSVEEEVARRLRNWNVSMEPPATLDGPGVLHISRE